MIGAILEKCRNREKLSDQEIACLLDAGQPKEEEQIFEAARLMREQVFGKEVFLYGFVYFSTYCRNNCSFCYYRRDNRIPLRYRKTKEEIVETAVSLKESGVHLIDLTTGEDPYYVLAPERLAEIVAAVKQATGLGVMVSPGLLDESGLKQIAAAGADWYALYQETHNQELFERLRLEQSYVQRMQAKEMAKKEGLLLEEGLLVGVGDTVWDRVRSFREMERIGASQVRAMTYVPQDGAPLQPEETCFKRELRTIAVMRLLFPEALIPASLDVDGLQGLKSRLQAGANVVTSIIPPQKGYAGVANSTRDIDEGYRTVSGIRDTLQSCGLTAGSVNSYGQWMKQYKQNMTV